MATKKPLVLGAGGIEQLQAGDTIAAALGHNPIINGDLFIWQRGTSAVLRSTTSPIFAADRWLGRVVGASVWSMKQSTDVPTVAQAGTLYPYSLQLDCSTPDTAIDANDLVVIDHAIIGWNWAQFAQQDFKIKFWVKSHKAGTYCLACSNNYPGAADRSYISEFSVLVADTWEEKTINVPASPSGGTWDYTTGGGLAIRFCIAAGSNFATTADAWQTGNFLCTTNQVNGADSASNDFRIAGIRMMLSWQDDAVRRSYHAELDLCLPYYERLTSPSNYLFIVTGQTFSTSSAGGPWIFRKEKRAIPTMAGSAVADFFATNPGGSPRAASTLSFNNIKTHSANLQLGGVSGSDLAAGGGAANIMIQSGGWIEANAEIV